MKTSKKHNEVTDVVVTKVLGSLRERRDEQDRSGLKWLCQDVRHDSERK